MKMKNIILIGNEPKNTSLDIWKLNTGIYVVSVDNIKDKNFIHFVLSAEAPILCDFDEKYLNNCSVNDMMDFCEKYDFIPMFISKHNKDLSHCAFLSLNDRFRESMEYTINEESKDYDDFIHICASYMKGDVENDNTISTSKRR